MYPYNELTGAAKNGLKREKENEERNYSDKVKNRETSYKYLAIKIMIAGN